MNSVIDPARLSMLLTAGAVGGAQVPDVVGGVSDTDSIIQYLRSTVRSIKDWMAENTTTTSVASGYEGQNVPNNLGLGKAKEGSGTSGMPYTFSGWVGVYGSYWDEDADSQAQRILIGQVFP